MEKSISAEKLLTLIENVRTARATVRALGGKDGRIDRKTEAFTKANSALALAEAALREESLRLRIMVTVLEPEPERREQVCCARTLPGYAAEE